ncbi:MAG TPA: serine/threonine-protein kinase [Kofleriaceae bacterium]|nr:serine/threonine-protein kinase [Kofleriaceae bacterium]
MADTSEPEASCIDENVLVELAEGKLDDTARAAIDAHIDHCAVCRALVAASQPTLPVADSMPAGASQQPRPRGSTLARYLILDVVGAGGNGIVYAAYDPELDRKVAVKVLRTEGADDGESRRSRTLREAQAMAKLSHENVVSVYDVGEEDGKVFVVMELIDGSTLTRYCEEPSRSWREIVGVFSRAGRGLAAAHAAGLVHRDFKPENVLIARDGRVLVTDFGLARVLDPATSASMSAAPGDLARALPTHPLTRTGAIAGTPAYMPLEQLRGEPLDARSDLFSFCVALYETLYRQRPFAGDSIEELAKQIEDDRVQPPPRASRVPAWVHRILVRGLSSRPEARFSSMAELLAALGRDPARLRVRALAAVGIVAVSVSAGAFMWRSHSDAQLVCQGADRALDDVWNVPRQQAMRIAFGATGRPFADATFGKVSAAFDRYARDWTDMRVRACKATRVSREQSEELMGLRMQCLDHRLDEMRALIALLMTPDAATLDEATRAAYKLTPLVECADAEALTAPVRPPRNPAVRIQVERLRVELAAAKALRDLGRYREQAERSAKLVAEAKAIGYKPLEADAQLLLGKALEINADYAHAADALHEAVWAAEAGRDLKLAVRARTELVWTVGHQLGKPELGAEYARDAEALLSGLGSDPELEAQVVAMQSDAAWEQGREEESMKLAKRVVDANRTLYGDVHPQTAIAMVNLAVGYSEWQRHADALPLYQQALAIYEQTLGTHHPLYAHTLFNVADAELGLARYSEARVDAERALALIETALGPEHALVASASAVLGLVAQHESNYEEAERHHARALALAEKLRGPRHGLVARYAGYLAASADAQGHHGQALELYRRARSIYEELGNELLLARTDSAIGQQQLASGALTDAVKTLERALRVQEPKDKSAPDLASTRFALARTLWSLPGGDRARATSLAKAAQAGYAEAGPGAASARADVAQWLDQHEVP